MCWRMVRSFLPIGQGAFYCECLHFLGKTHNIVYDCGSKTNIQILKEQIKTIPKITMDRFVSGIPHTTPTAIPVRAECPNASEKNAILLLTIIVPRMPNSGVIIRTARNAFLIKSY